MQESKEEEEEGQLRKPHIMPSKFMQAQPLQQPSRKPHIMPSKFTQAQPLQQPSQVLSYSLAGIGRGENKI